MRQELNSGLPSSKWLIADRTAGFYTCAVDLRANNVYRAVYGWYRSCGEQEKKQEGSSYELFR